MPTTDAPMFRRLRNRFLALNMALSSLILIAAFTAVYVATSASTHAQNLRDLQSLVDITASVLISDEGSNEEPSPSSPDVGPSPSLSYQREGTIDTVDNDEDKGVITVTGTVQAAMSAPTFAVTVDASGNVLSIDSLLDLPRETYEQAAAQVWGNPDGNDGGSIEMLGRQWLYEITPAGFPVIVDSVSEITVRTSEESHIRFLDVTESQTALRNLLLALIVVGLVALAAVGAVSLLFANRSIRPIVRAWERQRRFVADASHELKTPLSIITANSDALLANQEQTIASQREWLDYLRIGTDRMGGLIDDLLTFARVEDTNAPRPSEPVDLSMVAQAALQSLSAAMTSRRLQVTENIESGLTRVLEPGLADKVFFALLENAAEYADEGGRVEVTLRSTEESKESKGSKGLEGGTLFVVENSGPGIAEADLPHIFERFYRADSARQGDGHSFGLGLSIAQEAARRLGGEISVQSSAGTDNGGLTRFTVRL